MRLLLWLVAVSALAQSVKEDNVALRAGCADSAESVANLGLKRQIGGLAHLVMARSI